MEHCAILEQFVSCTQESIALPGTYPSSQDYELIWEHPYGQEREIITGIMGSPVVITWTGNESAPSYLRVKGADGVHVEFTVGLITSEILKLTPTDA